MLETIKSLGNVSPMDGHSRYVLIETLISVAINIPISALLMFLVFGRVRVIELWGGTRVSVGFRAADFHDYFNECTGAFLVDAPPHAIRPHYNTCKACTQPVAAKYLRSRGSDGFRFNRVARRLRTTDRR